MENDQKEEASEEASSQVGAGLHLVNPLIRITPEQYAQDNNLRVLVLGRGHVLDPHNVEPKEFRPGEGLTLRESYNQDYTYHQNKGRYTVSAELTRSFDSDMVCNLRNPFHQKSLARPDFWDLIWDDSGHVNVFEAPGLLEQIPIWLKNGGKYVVGIPSMSSRNNFDESTASVAQKIVHLKKMAKNQLTPELINFTITSLQELGFSKVEVRLSPTLQAVSALGISDLETITDLDILKIFNKAKEFTEEAAEIHPVFLEATLGMIYIVATC